MFCKLMKLPSAVLKERTEKMQKELALMEENTKKTVRERKILEEEMAKKTIEEMKGSMRRKTAIDELRNIC